MTRLCPLCICLKILLLLVTSPAPWVVRATREAGVCPALGTRKLTRIERMLIQDAQEWEAGLVSNRKSLWLAASGTVPGREPGWQTRAVLRWSRTFSWALGTGIECLLSLSEHLVLLTITNKAWYLELKCWWHHAEMLAASYEFFASVVLSVWCCQYCWSMVKTLAWKMECTWWASF